MQKIKLNLRIIFFADRVPPLIGGMETHAHYFVKNFKDQSNLIIISKKDGRNCLLDSNYKLIKFIEIEKFLELYTDEKVVVFYNSGRWIEDMRKIKNLLPHAITFYRTGGNEIIKAPLDAKINSYEERKKFWVSTINNCIDYLITNSEFTNKRLIEIGIDKKLLYKLSGGVDVNDISQAIDNIAVTRKKYNIKEDEILICSCARFVPYKRPLFLLESLIKVKEKCKVILVGDGPLLEESKKYVVENKLNVSFTGALDHNETLDIIAASNIYIQASTDLICYVEGGSYVHTEGMGRSLLEAICSGVPVVVTKCGAVSEFINENNGKLVTNTDEMALAIDELIKLDKEIDYENYQCSYSFEKIFMEYIKLWNERKY